MNLPGRKHFKALVHFLNHIRCYPPGPLVYYHDVHMSPLAKMLKEAGHPDTDPTLVWFTDSSHADCDEQRSTGCQLGFLQGGLIEFSSFVPNPIPGSSAESESNALCVGVLCAAHARQVYCDVVYNSVHRILTVPVFIDSTAAQAMNKNDKGTARTKHIEKRDLIHRYHRQCGYVEILHLNGDKYNLADIGTKSFAAEASYKLSIMEHPLESTASLLSSLEEG
jgi:hypothetical protein